MNKFYSVQAYDTFQPRPGIEYSILGPSPLFSKETRACMMGDAIDYVEAHLDGLLEALGNGFWVNLRTWEVFTERASVSVKLPIGHSVVSSGNGTEEDPQGSLPE